MSLLQAFSKNNWCNWSKDKSPEPQKYFKILFNIRLNIKLKRIWTNDREIFKLKKSNVIFVCWKLYILIVEYCIAYFDLAILSRNLLSVSSELLIQEAIPPDVSMCQCVSNRIFQIFWRNIFQKDDQFSLFVTWKRQSRKKVRSWIPVLFSKLGKLIREIGVLGRFTCIS